MTHLEIRRLTAEDANVDAVQVATIIGTAFAPLEVTKWLVPNPTDRVRMLAAQFTLFVEDALQHGEVLVGSDGPATSAGIQAAAVWFRELNGPHSLPDDYDERLKQICGEHVDRFRALDKAFAQHHQAGYPHHCLTYLATLPDHQGQGVGTALLRHTHRELDRTQVPAYLVASNARTRDWYAQHGYVSVRSNLRLPEGPEMWPMWRDPQDPDKAAL
ncbi:GNAT family N-acetyltransferase [Actinophytocola sp.]|uniref:GNAT family N-acetyltransferase n=1 Tax=Actinophytocola sp. TaxID=1872138 RepID=UPI00389A9A32